VIACRIEHLADFIRASAGELAAALAAPYFAAKDSRRAGIG
jgi:hypothetical protein